VDFRQTHPGQILKQELDARDLSAAAFALRIRVAPQRIQEIVAGKRAISPETALRLGRYFGNKPEFWLSMQAAYDLALARAHVGKRVEAEVETAA
jgi:addiction module HigA family antidote